MHRLFLPGATPPEGMRRWLPVWGPPVSGQYLATLLADDLVQIVCHWSGRLFPCPGPSRCLDCQQGKEPHFMGFMPAIVGSPVNDHAVLRLTPYASDDLLALRLEREGRLRGVRLKMWRKSESTKARVRLTEDGVSDARKLPAAWDVIPHLRRLWGCPEGYPLIRDMKRWFDEAASAMLDPSELLEGGEE